MSEDPFKDARLFARMAPHKQGKFADGPRLPDDGGATVLLALDANGRVFEIVGAHLSNGTFSQLANGRTELLALIEKFDIQDLPDFGDVGGA